MAASEIQITIFVSRQPAGQNIYLTTSLTHSLTAALDQLRVVAYRNKN